MECGPKGRKILAEGFSPGLGKKSDRPESGGRKACSSRDALISPVVPTSGATFPPSLDSAKLWRTGTAHLFVTTNPRLKPWAIIFCPFGA